MVKDDDHELDRDFEIIENAIDFEAFGEGLGRVWGGFGQGLGLIFGSKMTFGPQSGDGMFKKCLGTFDRSFGPMFLNVWG